MDLINKYNIGDVVLLNGTNLPHMVIREVDYDPDGIYYICNWFNKDVNLQSAKLYEAELIPYE